MSAEKSTIVRAMRPMFATLERIAPAVGSVLAERLWCAIPPGRALTAQRPGTRFTVPYGTGHVVAERWGEGPAVYLLHGWGGRRAQFDAFVAPLVAAGHQVIAFDVPSHGESTPGAFGADRGLLTEFIGALRAVVEVGGQASAVLGHSAGGASAALAILDGLPVGRLVMIGAMADPSPYTIDFARTLGFGERIRTRFLRRLERRVDRLMTDFDVPSRARVAGALPPALVVHDTEDKEVYYADAQAVAAAWTGAQLVTTTGLGHRRILRDPGVIERVVSYVATAPVRS